MCWIGAVTLWISMRMRSMVGLEVRCGKEGEGGQGNGMAMGSDRSVFLRLTYLPTYRLPTGLITHDVFPFRACDIAVSMIQTDP